MAAPAQHSQPSRKGKASWRKNIDVASVQDGLDAVRQQLTVTGAVIAERPSNELFVVDTTGDKNLQAAYHKRQKPLKVDEILAQRSAVSAVPSRKRGASASRGTAEARTKRARVSAKEYERLRKIAYGGETTHKDVVRLGEHSYDPWTPIPTVQHPQFSFLEAKKPIKEPGTLKRAPVCLAANQKPIPAVRMPQAGKSYNPTASDWAELLQREGDKAVETEKRRIREAAEEAEQLRRAQEPDPDSSDTYETEWEGIQSSADETVQQQQPERKTQAQRNKDRRRRADERAALKKMREKEQNRQANRIPALEQEVAEKEAERARCRALAAAPHDTSDEEEVLRRRGFGKAPIPEPPLEVVLTDELQDSLRRLQPEGNLLKDRYRSLIVRGRVESRRPVVRKKAKTTMTEKWSYKDWNLDM